MSEEAVLAAIALVRELGRETAQIEVKACETKLSKSVWESVSAFANTSGGIVILGLSEETNFSPVPGFAAQRIFTALLDGLREGQGQKVNPIPGAMPEIIRIDGAYVVALEIEAMVEDPSRNLPCYVVQQGIQAGSYRRVDDRDERLSAYEIYALQTRHNGPQDVDRQPVDGAAISDLSESLVDRMLARQRDSGSKMFDGIGSGDRLLALRRLSVVRGEHDQPTLAGLLAMGIYPQQFFPQLTVDVSVHPLTEKAAADGVRFVDRKQCDGALPDVVESAVATVARHLRTMRIVDGVAGSDELEIPAEVLREAIANAVAHRDYSERAQSRQVSVDVYPDRVEITSPGGFWGTRTAENIAEGVSDSRNRVLSALLTKVPRSSGEGTVAENAGTGVLKMIALMKQKGLRAPDYSKSSLSSVVLSLYRFGLIDPGMAAWLRGLPGGPRSHVEDSALAIAKSRGQVKVGDLKRELGLDSDDARAVLCKLLDEKLLEGNLDGPLYVSERAVGGLTAAQRDVLAVLDPSVELSIRDIAEKTGRSVGALRVQMRDLVAMGLVAATAPATSRNRRYLRAERDR
ncbi:ATP-binding protein [Actinomyces culturomici]|uniref:ATP-binding protein n=1 Tax=Actinomyces culturomici TaxID=1926276 RepID=UPI000E20B59E|nr:ATP-binding protein [Actinomyces culturomici]